MQRLFKSLFICWAETSKISCTWEGFLCTSRWLGNSWNMSEERYLAIDDNWCVDIGSRESIADGIKIWLKGSSWVANWNAVVGKSWVLFLQWFHDFAKGDEFLNFNFAFLLGYINNFEFAIGLSSAFNNFDEFFFIGLDGGTLIKIKVLY